MIKSKRPRIVLVNRSFVVNSKGKILLLERSLKDEYSPGLWEVPGGKLDEGQDISHALEREVFEETGLLVTPALRVGYFESEIIPKGKYKGMSYITIIGVSKVDGGSVKISHEHDSYAWVELSAVSKYNLCEVTRKAFIILKKELRKIIRNSK